MFYQGTDTVKFKLQVLAGFQGLRLNFSSVFKTTAALFVSALCGQPSVARLGLGWWSAPQVLEESPSCSSAVVQGLLGQVPTGTSQRRPAELGTGHRVASDGMLLISDLFREGPVFPLGCSYKPGRDGRSSLVLERTDCGEEV